jgi:hypothetical protein
MTDGGLIRRRWWLLPATLAAALLAVIVLSSRSGDAGTDPPGAELAACIDRVASEEQQAAEGEALTPEAGGEGEEEASCGVRRPEPFEELKAASGALGQRIGADSPADALASARLAQRGARAHGHPVPGTGGRWQPVGSGPLHADDPAFPETYGNGFGELAGRISDYARDPAHDRLYAAVASGGIWESGDGGSSWRSIGDRLPTQTTGSVEYSPARGGTLIVVTGDNAFGGNTYGGLGVYTSVNDGRSWKRSKGVPNGVQGFKAAVDPTNPKVVYAATGAGLFRSKDGGRRFVNVDLPTGGGCEGNTLRKQNCFFANVVTDVVVQSPDGFGNEGGAVLAAVGWRDGPRKNFNGVPEAPGNGLYASADGAPGSFKGIDEDAAGFTPQAKVGRVELGVASGPDQNHDYVYAIVQDAELFNKGTIGGLDVPDAGGLPVNPTATPTYLNGVYVSADFGRTWKVMANSNQILLPTSGSTLAQLSPLGFGPGIQSWYNEWIEPDPTQQSGGVPTRLLFGLEEIYENRLPTPQDGQSDFKVIGPYNATGGPCLLVLATPACAAASDSNPNRYTTHPDQHAAIFVPGDGGVKLLAGNDGGNYTQQVGAGGDFTQAGFGTGDDDGFHTLLPYGVAAARDGVVYAGLQDNGEMKITPDGRQVEVYGGDGVFTQVDPANSDIAYEEVPEAGISVTTDGGVSWRSIDPLVDNASFYAPLVMDPLDANHLMTGGQQIVETHSGPATTSPGDDPTDDTTDWKQVFDLGDSRQGVANQTSAIAMRGSNAYAAYCGGCDPVRDETKFFSGLATNVPPKPHRGKSPNSSGWHLVPAKGLPQRFISNVTIDPRRKRTIYVTLGASSLRPYAPPNSLGASGESSRGGHIYKSTDAGRTFKDISGNLRRTPALWSIVHRKQLIVATTVGVFASRGTSGGHYALLGRKLPAAPVFSLATVPGKSREIVAASLGRGVYRYRFR